MFEEITAIIELIDDDNKSLMPPKLLYNEDYMLRLIMYWFYRQDNFIINSDSDRKICKAFKCIDDARCYTKATIETPFKVRIKGTKDSLAESSAIVSGVVGNFKILYGKKKERLVLLDGAKQFVVIETTMFSELKKGIKCNKKYNQVARDVSCMINTIRSLGNNFIDNIGFYVIAPKDDLKLESFKNYTYKKNIEETIKNRIDQYGIDEDKQAFFDLFQKYIYRLDVDCISFEDTIRFIKKNDINYGNKLNLFYDKCLIYHGK